MTISIYDALYDIEPLNFVFNLKSENPDIVEPSIDFDSIKVSKVKVIAGDSIVVSFMASDQESGLLGSTDDSEYANQNGYIYAKCPSRTYHGWAHYNRDSHLIELEIFTNKYDKAGKCVITQIGAVRDNANNETGTIAVKDLNVTFIISREPRLKKS